MKVTSTGNTKPVINDTGRSEGQKRADAIAAFKASTPVTSHGAKTAQPSTKVVQNQSSVQAEEMGAVIPKPNIRFQTTEPKAVLTQPEAQGEAQESTPPQSPSNEAKSNTEATSDVKTEALSSQYAVLARKERQMRIKAQQQAEQLKSRETELAAKEAELQKRLSEYETGYISKARLKDETLVALEEAGLSYDEITQKQIEAGTVDPRMLAHIKRLEAKIADMDKQSQVAKDEQKTYQQEQVNQALAQIKRDAEQLISTDPAFELTRNSRQADQIVELIKLNFNDTGEVMSVEEAAQQVEKELEERMYKVIDKTEKIKKRYAPKAETSEAKETTTEDKTQKQSQQKTLTNKTGTSRQLSARERAVLAFKGEL